MNDTKTELKSPSISHQLPREKKIRQGDDVDVDRDEKSERVIGLTGMLPTGLPVSSSDHLPKDSKQTSAQEYVTAHDLRQGLQGYQGEEGYKKALQWIAQHKYEPRYAVVMGFLAGLTVEPGYDQAMQAFWYAVLSPPFDVMGGYHLRLVVRCLEEARLDKRIPAREALLGLVREWVTYVLRYGGDQYGWEEDLSWFMDALGACPQVIQQGGVVALCIKALQDESGDVRKVAAMILGKIGMVAPGTPDLVAVLRQALRDENTDVRQAAAEALGKIGMVAPDTPGVMMALGDRALKDQEVRVRRAAAEALREIAKVAPGTPDLVKFLLQAMKDTQSVIRRTAAEVLGKIGAVAPGTPGLVAALLQALRDEREGVRLAAAEALGEIGQVAPSTPDLVVALFQMLGDTSWQVQQAAAGALGKIGAVAPGTPGLVGPLLVVLQSKNPWIRQVAAEALGKIGQGAPSTPGLVAALFWGLQDEAWEVRQTAAWALNKIHKVAPEAVGLVTGLLQVIQHKNIQENALLLCIHFTLDVLLQFYMDAEHQAMLTQQPLAPVWRQVITNCIGRNTFSMGIVLLPNRLQVVTDTQSDTLTVPSPEALRRLFTILKEQCEKNKLPLPPTWEQCCGETPRYLAKEPIFKPATAPTVATAPNQLSKPPVDEKSSPVIVSNTTGATTASISSTSSSSSASFTSSAMPSTASSALLTTPNQEEKQEKDDKKNQPFSFAGMMHSPGLFSPQPASSGQTPTATPAPEPTEDTKCQIFMCQIF